jgi:hypothetical protein
MTEQERQNTEIILKLPLGAVDAMVNIIADRPYKQIAGLIESIRAQVIPQMPVATTPETEPEDAPVQ